MFYLIIASGIAGLLLGRIARVYALIPAAFLLIIPASYFTTDGFWSGLFSFLLGLVTMQAAYFVSILLHILTETPSVHQAPSDHSALTDILSTS